MNNITAEFGYNTDLEHNGFTAWENMGSKYNFNIAGNVLGVFSWNGQYYLLSQVTSSFGDNCMVGTIDAREVIIGNEDNFNILVSNNEPSKECMAISRMLSVEETKKALSEGKQIEQTKGFESLARLGIELDRQNLRLSEVVTVCGVEPVNFESIKAATMGKAL